MMRGRLQSFLMKQIFNHINCWIFDLDHTLYPEKLGLFEEIDNKMTGYIMKLLNLDWHEANELRQNYYKNYGTTLAGLMRHHEIDPHAFLDAVDRIDLSKLSPNAALKAQIDALKGRKIIYTNGSRTHALRTSKALGLYESFDALYGIEDANFIPKPQKAAFDIIFKKANITPMKAAFFEDSEKNLHAPHELGVTTFLIGKKTSPYVDYAATDVGEILRYILKE